MSASVNRQESPPLQAAEQGWGRRLQLVAMIVLGLVFAGLTVYHLVFKDESLVDARRLAALRDQELGKKLPSSGDWPQWRGPNRDGIATAKETLMTWGESGPLRLWEQPVGKGYGTVAVAGGRVYLLMQDGGNESCVCWDARTGTELWRFSYAADYRNAYGDGPRATPSVDGDRVYTVGATGIMHCLKTHPAAPHGEQVWRHDLLDEFGAANLQWGVSFSPLVAGDLVYANPGGRGGNSMAAFDKRTGKKRWTAGDDQAGYSSPVLATIAGRPQIVFFTAAGLVGLTPDKGEILWRFPWETSYGANVATPIVAGDYIFISSGYNRGCAVVHIESAGNDLVANRVYENKNMRNHFSSSVLYRDHIYGFNETLLTCLEFRTGKVLWKQRGFDKGSLLIADGRLVILGEDGKLGLAAATPDAFRAQASFQVANGRCWSVPALASGLLYVRGENKLMCFDLGAKRAK